MPIDLRLDPDEVSILNDLYEFTVAAAFFERGMTGDASFEVMVRRFPASRGYMIAAGLERVLQVLEDFHFDPKATGLAVVLTAGLANLSGWLASFRILRQKPLEVLREE